MNFKTMLPRLVMIVVVAIFVTACGRGQSPAEPPTPTPTPIVFNSAAGGFSLTVPEGWTATEAANAAFGDHTILGQVNLDLESSDERDVRPGLIYYADTRELSPEQALMTLCHARCPSQPPMAETIRFGRPVWMTTLADESWTFVDNGDVLVFFNMLHATDAESDPVDPMAFAANSMHFTPMIDGERRAHEAADALREALAVRTDDDVQIVGIDAVTWPDACLGAPLADELCAEVETPGYRIELETPAGLYVYHLEPISTQTRLAAAPQPQTGDPLIVWSSLSQPCMTALIGEDGLGFGACGGVLMPGVLADDDRRAELVSFAAMYAGFEAQTPAGDLTFFGNGTRTATPTEERMIAEWARQAVSSASGDGGNAESVMNWARNGGIIQACDSLRIELDGRVHAFSCRDGEEQEIGQRMLTLEEAVQFYTWVDLLRNAEHTEGDAAPDRGLAVALDFAGAGVQDGTSTDARAMLIFAAATFDEMAATVELERPVMEAAAGCPEAVAGTSMLANEADGYCLHYPAAYDLFQPMPDQVVIAVDSLLNFAAPSVIVTTSLVKEKTADEAPLDAGEGPTTADPSLPITFVHEDKLVILQFYPPDAPTDDGLDLNELYAAVVESFTFLP